jgi:DNA adenine methylase
VNQQTLFELRQVVNVSKVRQYSPFRYPGGKTWLVPWVRQWLHSLPAKPVEFIEPFVGGGSISLTVAFEDLADHVLMIELDDQIAAVWRTILSRNREWLAERIVRFKLSYATAIDVIKTSATSTRQKAFQTLVKNRTYHGGILANGSGLLKHGENGKGIHSRWYPQTLYKRIMDIGKVAHRMTFAEGDGIEAIRRYANIEHGVFFIDPPYTAGGKKAGKRLYRFCDLDHSELFRVVSTVRGDFLMTYDDAPEVEELARTYGFDTYRVPMKGTHHILYKELLIGRDLDWARTAHKFSAK